MDKIKVMSIFGTRPEAIKMAPLIKKLNECQFTESKVCITAQHREMLDQVLKIFNIKPDFDLNIMKNKQSLTEVTNNILRGMEEVFQLYKPDIILVHGDTTTTFSAALAAFYEKIEIGHVEAGLRTFNKFSPYPEEINRKLTGVMSDLHFAPTELSKNNLLAEGIPEENIFITGNTVIDALKTTVKNSYIFKTDILNKIDYKNRKVIMITAHRRENWGEPLENICRALRDIVLNNKDVELVYLVHLNPIVKDTVEKYLKNIERVHLLNPLDTDETHNLMNLCYMIITDSGGLQEEAPSLGIPVLVLRDVTERPEAVEAGTVKLIGTDYDKIRMYTEQLLNLKEIYNEMCIAANPYGDGFASERIINALLYYFGIKSDKPEEYRCGK